MLFHTLEEQLGPLLGKRPVTAEDPYAGRVGEAIEWDDGHGIDGIEGHEIDTRARREHDAR
jgi:hypothetical protein